MSSIKLPIYFSPENIHPQKLPFSKPINFYILTKINAAHLRKLYKICKLFYLNFPFENIQEIEYLGFSIQNNAEKIINLPPLLSANYSIYFQERQLYNFKLLLSKIIFCDIQYLGLYSSHFSYLSWNEYEFLTKAGNIKELVFHNVIVLDGDAQRKVSIDKLISQLPNADNVRINPCHISQSTMPNLLSMKRKVLFSLLNLSSIDKIFDSNEFYEFIIKSFHPNSHISLWFDGVKYVTEFKKAVNEKLLLYKSNYFLSIN